MSSLNFKGKMEVQFIWQWKG